VTNSVHDMGGMHGFGPVEREENEPVFHEPWEGRVYGMNRALGKLGLWTIDMGRAAQEMLPPRTYLAASYYQRWFLGLRERVLANRLATEDEIAAGHAQEAGRKVNDIFTPENVATMTRGSFERPSTAPPRFAPGDRVRTVNINPATHTRLPRYARDKVGMVEAVRGCHVYPDTVAVGAGENPQWLYTVVFSGRTLWGPDAEPGTRVSIEAFEPYLEPEPA